MPPIGTEVELRVIGNFDLTDARVAKIFNDTLQGGIADIFWDARSKAPIVEVRKYPSRARRGLPTRFALRDSIYVQTFHQDEQGNIVPSGQTATGNRIYAMQAGFRQGSKAEPYVPYVIYGTGPKHGMYKGLKFIPEPRATWQVPGKFEYTSDPVEYAQTEGSGTSADPYTDILVRRFRRRSIKFKPMVLPNPPRVWTAADPETFGGEIVVGVNKNGSPMRRFHPNIIERRGRGRLKIPGQEHNPFLQDAIMRGRVKMRKQIKEAMTKAIGAAANDLHFRMYVRVR